MTYKITIEHSDDEKDKPCTYLISCGGQTDFEAALFFAIRGAVRYEDGNGDRRMLTLLASVIWECADWFDEPRADDMAALIDSAIAFIRPPTEGP